MLWLTLAQSWARLAEYVAQGAPELAAEGISTNARAANSD
jgi:hypothetical protein